MRLTCVLLGFSLFVFSGCNAVGDRSMMMLSPEEKDMVVKAREQKKTPSRTKQIGRELIGKSATEEKEDAWGFKWSWDRGISAPGKPSADNPNYDDEGNPIVSPEVARTYSAPDLHTGLLFDVKEKKVRAALEVEVFELKVPKLRYMPFGVLGAEQFLGVHLSKRWSSIFEIESGIFCGEDFNTHEIVWGLSGLIIKF